MLKESCVVFSQLSHVFKGANKYQPVAAMARAGAPGATEFRLLAEHLGGIALRDYHAALDEIVSTILSSSIQVYRYMYLGSSYWHRFRHQS